MQKLTTKASDIIQSIFIPFVDPMKLNNNKDKEDAFEDLKKKNDSSFGILNSRKAKRPPRFFFRSTYLIPYSSIKAKLQMAIDSKDIEQGVTPFY